jgi:hypothetical protein
LQPIPLDPLNLQDLLRLLDLLDLARLRVQVPERQSLCACR